MEMLICWLWPVVLRTSQTLRRVWYSSECCFVCSGSESNSVIFFFRFFFFAFVTMVVTSNRSLSNHLLTQVPVTHTHQPWHSLISTPLSLWTIDATSLTDPHTSPLFTFTYSVFLLMTFSISLRVTNSDSRRVTSSVSYKYKRLKTIQTVQLSRCCLASLLSCLPSITLM